MSAPPADRIAVLVSDRGLGGIVAIGGALRRLGWTPALISGPADEQQVADWRSHHDSVVVVDDPYDVDVLVAAARRIVDELGAAGNPGALYGLFSCYDGCTVPAAAAAERLGLPHCDAAALRRSRNKFEAREWLLEHGVDDVPAALAGVDSDLGELERTIGPYPWIVKPVNGVASLLVVKCHDRDEVHQALRRLRQGLTDDDSGMFSRPIEFGADGRTDPAAAFLVEPFLSGTEYSAELVVHPGGVSRILLLRKIMVDDRSFFEVGFLSPAESDITERVWRFVEQAVLGIGLDSAMCHVEVIDTGARVHLVEINAGRPGGGLIAPIAQRAAGRDELVETVTAALREWEPTAAVTDLDFPVGMVVSYPTGTGVVQRIDGIEAAGMIPGVVLVSPFLHPGDVITDSDREFFGVMALTSGLGVEAVVDVHRELDRLVDYVIDPG